MSPFVNVGPNFPREIRDVVAQVQIGMKTDRIRTDITDIIFVFIFLVGFEFEYG